MYDNIKKRLKALQEKNPLTVHQSLLVLVLSLSFILRLYNIRAESLYLDEIYSLERSKLEPNMIYEVSYRPLYFFLLHYWMKIFGTSVMALRIPAMLFGTLSVFILYKTARLLFDENIAALSALLLAISEFHIWQSQEVRMYSMLAFFAALSVYFFLVLINKKRSWPIAIGYLLSSILLLFTHPFGVFILLVQNTFFFTLYIHEGSDLVSSLKGWILLQILLFISFIPLLSGYLGMASGIQSGQGLSWLSKPTIGTVLLVFNEYSGHILLFILFVLVMGIYTYQRYRKGFKDDDKEKEEDKKERELKSVLDLRTWIDIFGSSERIYFLALWILVPNILPFIASLLWKPIYGPPKYTIAASLGFYVLVALSISRLDMKKLKIGFVVLILLIGAFNLGMYYSTPEKEQWEDVAGLIDEEAEREDMVIFNAGFTQFCFDYYSDREDLVKRSFPNETRPRWPSKLSRNVDVNQSHMDELNNLTEGRDRVWLVLSHTSGDTDLIIQQMKEDFDIDKHKTYVQVEVYLFVRE